MNNATSPSSTPLQLRDIHLPSSPDLWPPAPGWWLLTTIILFLCAWLFLKFLAAQKQKKKQQAIYAALKPIEQKLLSKPTNQAVADLNIFIRQLALMYFPQTEIASLSGRQWLAFLDQSGKTQQFTHGAGRILAEAPYLPEHQKVEKPQAKALLKVVKKWVKNTEATR